METTAANEKNEMSTLVECIKVIRTRGYKTSFIAESGERIKNEAGKLYGPASVKINNFYRFEGESDPGDSSILYAIEANDGTKGYITNAYGPYADIKVSAFIEKVEDIQKHVGNKRPSLWQKFKNLFH